MKYSETYLKSLYELEKFINDFEKLKNKKVLITGATGLIGSAIADLLLNSSLDIEVLLAGRCEERVKNRFYHWSGKYKYIEYDATKAFETDEKFDFIIHCASNAHPMAYADHPVETITTNVFGTENILKCAKKNSGCRVLYVSSSEVYGNKKNANPFIEDEYYSVDILNPRACYPSSKRLCETLCSAYIAEYGLDIVVVRPGHVYGPTMTESDSRAHAQFARDVVYGRDIVMKSDGMQIRSYCYVLDCVSALLTVLLCGKKGEAYNISNKRSIVTIRQFAEMHAKISGKKIVFVNPCDEEAKGYNMMQNSALCSDKLENLGWEGTYDLFEGVASTLENL